MKFLLFLFLNCSLLYASGQQFNSSSLHQGQDLFIQQYLLNKKINIIELRRTTNFLTNVNVKTTNGIQITKRSNAVIRHVKHLSERIEEVYLENSEIDSVTMELLVELEYINLSFKKKAESNQNAVPSFKMKLFLIKNTIKNKRRKRYKITAEPIFENTASPYWNSVNDTLYQEFGNMANSKKIDAEKEMVVIFNELTSSGSAPKIETIDLDLDNEWVVKWGDELHSDVVGSRLFAAMGYDVDHPYFYGKDKLTLVFDSTKTIKNWTQLRDSVYVFCKVDITPYFSNQGNITEEMILINPDLSPYLGRLYVQFIKCGLEARPDRVKRLGSFLPDDMNNENNRALRAALLLHAFIGNWDTKEENTLLTLVHDGNYNYKISAIFSDLGTSFGVKTKLLPLDFKVGLVNEFSWEAAKKVGNKVILQNQVNVMLTPYGKATYMDLKWMASKIEALDSLSLRKCLSKAMWPYPIEELYFNKLASRRASILRAFDIEDNHPIAFDKKITIFENNELIVKKGKLKKDYKRYENPESLFSKKGRNRNYGN